MAASHYLGRPPRYGFDRGRAKHFHGRTTILANFQEMCNIAIEETGGTIFLVHGAPGAGKTALLYECADMAARNGWLVAPDLEHMALADEEVMKDAMADLFTLQMKDGNTVRKGVSERAGGWRPSKVLAHGDKPLLLVIDEAQNLRTLSDRPITDPEKAAAVGTLSKIHNGTIGRPIILLAGGLSDTEDVFAGLGISRFDDMCTNALVALSDHNTRAVIHDWLFYQGEVLEEPTEWVDAIAPATHGWPQHIIAYLRPALRRVARDRGQMTSEGLAHVLKQGQLGRQRYCSARTSTFEADELTALIKAIQAAGPDEHVDQFTIVTSLSATFSHQKAERLFNHAVRKGVLSKAKGFYSIPIPSMRSWLDRELGSLQLGSER